MIFDTHAHYDDERFDEDREQLFSSMKENGVGNIVNVSATYESCLTTLKYTRQFPFVYGAIGVHPTETAGLDEDKFNNLRQYAKEPKVVAIGEIGLDYYWDEPDREIQKKWFVKQLELARELKLPVNIHSRDAAEDTMKIMKENHAEEIGGIIHCYSYSSEMALEYVKMGFYIGVGGVVTFKNSRKLKEVVEKVPIDKIVVETDAPYLAPEPHRGHRNTSINLKYVVEEIAKIKGMTTEEVIKVTEANAKKVYGLERNEE
ncbi:MAG: TatD family deoxyribonuclease [Lachnospiraceae bacterium]|nr:TatD family deoxyribonuclease [Lachnospiraceae bacterium]